jgi:DNA-binding HxlR family transcriptional regulator
VSKLDGRWKLLIISKLEKKQYRFGELKKEFSYMSERMLALQLKALEQDGLIRRTVFAEVPPRVEYRLTQTGMELGPILEQLSEWGARQRQMVDGIGSGIRVVAGSAG